MAAHRWRGPVESAAEVYRFRSLLRYLVGASLRTEHAGMALGFVWWLLDPLLKMAIFTFVFDVVLTRGTHNYPFFLLCAIVPFQATSRAVRNSVSLMLARHQLMKQVSFPRVVIPLASTIAEFVHLV